MLLKRREFLSLGMAACVSACSLRRSSATNNPRSAGAPLIWGGEGFRNGSFMRPRAMGVSGDEVHVIDTTGRVQAFTMDGEFVRLWKTPDASNGTPTAVGYGLDGRVLVPDTHYSRILEYTREGELLTEWGTYGSAGGDFIYPTGIVQGADGTMYVAEYGERAERVQVFDAERRFVRQWGHHGEEPGAFNRAMAIAQDSAGTIYVADMANHRIQCFDVEGTLVRIVGEAGTEAGKLKFPFDIALAPDESLVVCEYGTHRVSRFDPSGAFMAAYGSPGRGPGEFNGPRGVTVSEDGRVFVADTDNHRIQRFDLEVLT